MDLINDLDELSEAMKSYDPNGCYFAMRLGVTDRNIQVSFTSHWCGFPEGADLASGRELREASPVDPQAMVSSWKAIGEDWVAVHSEAELTAYLALGGNALIDERLARQEYKGHVEPHEVTRGGPLGFEAYRPASRPALQRRPRPDLRDRVLKRDNYECQLCGARKDDGATLELHHVRNFSRGGLTIFENLLALCSKCHTDLDPHQDLGLFRLPGGLEAQARARRADEVERYRARVKSMIERHRRTGNNNDRLLPG